MANQGFMNKLLSSVGITKNYNFPLFGLGAAGTDIFSGQFDEEYLSKLKGTQGINVYSQMRRNDAQVSMLLKTVKNPILGARWYVEPHDESDQADEMAGLVEHVLFNDMRYPDGSKSKTFLQFIEEAMTMMEYGFSLFEVIHKVVTGHPVYGDYIGLKDLAYRHPRSIEEWVLYKNGGLKAVRQVTDGDNDVDVLIPGRHLLVFTNRKEGDNYEGISELRPIYGNHFRKNVYYKIQAIGLERSANGIPVGTVNDEVALRDDFKEQFEQLKDVMEQLASHQRRSLALPPGFSITELKINHDAEKVLKAIESENLQMAKSFLQNFMELGTGNSGGSYSLGTDLSDMFLSGIELYAKQICANVNDVIVKRIIDFKYGEQTEYPKLRCTGINDKAGNELATMIVSLVSAGMIKPSDKMREYVHQRFGFPVPDFEAEEAEDAAAPEAASKADGEEDKNLSDTPAYIQLAQKNAIAEIKSKADSMHALMQSSLTERTDEYINRVLKAMEKEGAKSRKAVMGMTLKGQRKYGDALLAFLAEVGDEAAKRVLKELGKADHEFADAETKEKMKGLPKASREKIAAEVDLIVAEQDAQLQKAVLFTFNSQLDTTDSVDAMRVELKAASDKYLASAALQVGATNFVSAVTNGVRNDVFQTPEVFSDIESFVYFNPDPKSDICKALSGRVFSKEEYKTSRLLPPNHHNCKSIVTAQTLGAVGNKPVDPLGLTPTGTDEQVKAIMKSKTL